AAAGAGASAVLVSLLGLQAVSRRVADARRMPVSFFIDSNVRSTKGSQGRRLAAVRTRRRHYAGRKDDYIGNIPRLAIRALGRSVAPAGATHLLCTGKEYLHVNFTLVNLFS